MNQLTVASSKLSKSSLKGDVAVISGAGRGIGYEAARSLSWLGATVIIAEIDEKTGLKAASDIGQEFGADHVKFLRTDVSDEASIENLMEETIAAFGKVDIVLNNATIFPMGALTDVPIAAWDKSYGVNLRGPVLLARAFLPSMLKRKHGVFVCVSSSGAAPFMGAYEVFKTAQVELSTTIAAEVEDTGVFAFCIGPGIVPTPGFLEGGGQVANYMGITTQQLLDMNKGLQLTPEQAGAGFAAAIALASNYHGKETSSIQVLKDIGIDLGGEKPIKDLRPFDKDLASTLMGKVLFTYKEQSEGWKKRNLFERQWVFRDFRKSTGMTIDEMMSALEELRKDLGTGSFLERGTESLKKLHSYYMHQQELLRGFEKDPMRLERDLKVLRSWIDDIESLMVALGSNLPG